VKIILISDAALVAEPISSNAGLQGAADMQKTVSQRKMWSGLSHLRPIAANRKRR
jgi:hypothetical protein